VDYDFNQIFKDVRSISRAVSLVRILKICIIVLLGLLLFIIFERRTDFFNRVWEPILIKSTEPIPTSFTLTEQHLKVLDKILQTFPGVNGVAVISVDLRENTKNVLFKSIDKKLIGFLDLIPESSPLFTNNGELNNRTVYLMSGEVHCMDSSKYNLGALVPNLEQVMPFSCAIPIPPTYGDFSGWIFVGFDRVLEDKEFLKFKTVVTKISADIKKGA
jgi:hypothetical protein